MCVLISFLRAWRYAVTGTSYGLVSVSVTSHCFIETDIAGFGMEASFSLSFIVLWRNSSVYKIKGTSLCNFVLNSRFKKVRHCILIIKTCYQLSSSKVDAQSVIIWTIFGQQSWQHLHRPLVYYLAMLCIRGTSHGPVSVSVCVCVYHMPVFY